MILPPTLPEPGAAPPEPAPTRAPRPRKVIPDGIVERLAPWVLLAAVGAFVAGLPPLPTPRAAPRADLPVVDGATVVMTRSVRACAFAGSPICRHLSAEQRMIVDGRDNRGNIRLLYHTDDKIGWWAPVDAVDRVR